jgi:hypothetical protein
VKETSMEIYTNGAGRRWVFNFNPIRICRVINVSASPSTIQMIHAGKYEPMISTVGERSLAEQTLKADPIDRQMNLNFADFIIDE